MRLNDDLTPKSDSQPINHADYASMQHDIAYMQAKDNYDKNPTKENRQRQLKKVWDADDQFIDEMKRDKEEPMAPIAGKLIKNLEQAHLLSTKRFEGFGSSDPTARLKELVKSKYRNEEKKQNKQSGGILPIVAAVETAAATAIATKLAGDLYEFIKKKISGQRYKIPYHNTKKEKKQFLLEVVKNI